MRRRSRERHFEVRGDPLGEHCLGGNARAAVQLGGDEGIEAAEGSREREYLLPELLKIGWGADSTAAERTGSLAAFNYRMVEVVMMLMLPLLAISLAIPPKRSTSALGVFLAIVMVVTYHKINQYAEAIGSLGKIDPLIALWTPFVLFAALVGWMFYTIAYVPDGQPIGGLERVAGKVGKWIVRRIPGRRPEAQA